MEVMKKASEPMIPQKRPPDDSNDCVLERFRKQKRMVQAVRDFPPGCGIQETDREALEKLRNDTHPNRVQAVRDFPPGCGIQETDTEPLEKLGNNIHPNRVQAVRDFPPGCGIQNTETNPLMKLSPKSGSNKLNNFKPNEFGSNKPEFGSSPRKVRFWDQTCSKNVGAEKPKLTTAVVTQRKPLKHLDSVDIDLGTTVSHDKDAPVKYDELKKIEVADFKRNKPSFGSKPAGKVKFWDPTCTNASPEKQPKVTTTIVSRGKPLKNNIGEDNKPPFVSTSLSQKDHMKREKIKEVMKYFDEAYKQLYQDNRLKQKGEKIAHWRVPVQAAKLVQQKFKWMDPEKRLGRICGVHVGDKFKFRSQLKMTGLHCQLQSGIDYTNIEGKNLAVSIVDAHRYSNKRGSSDMMIYCGHGGLTFLGRKLPPEDQKLVRGNLALKNSINERTPVRVIRKLDGVFVYDGLYVVTHYTQKKGEEGKIVFNFHLKRESGQPPLDQMLNAKC